jgi:hypothetical protein
MKGYRREPVEIVEFTGSPVLDGDRVIIGPKDLVIRGTDVLAMVRLGKSKRVVGKGDYVIIERGRLIDVRPAEELAPDYEFAGRGLSADEIAAASAAVPEVWRGDARMAAAARTASGQANELATETYEGNITDLLKGMPVKTPDGVLIGHVTQEDYGLEVCRVRMGNGRDWARFPIVPEDPDAADRHVVARFEDICRSRSFRPTPAMAPRMPVDPTAVIDNSPED